MADYDKVHADYSSSIDAMSRALSTLAARASGKIGVLLQLKQALPKQHRKHLEAFLQEPFGMAASSYEFHTDSIQDMVENLKSKMSDERADAEKEEMSKKNSFQLLEQQLSMDIEAATEERDGKAELMAQRSEDSASSKGDASETADTKAADEKYLADLTAQCELKAGEFEQRQALRDGEQQALAKAIEIISSKAVSGASEKHLPQLLQAPRSFALRASGTDAGMRKRVAVFLQGRATKADSRLLQRVAAKLTEAGPFDKVRQMIADMITKLSQEAAEAADHKAWCDGELKGT